MGGQDRMSQRRIPPRRERQEQASPEDDGDADQDVDGARELKLGEHRHGT